MPDFQDHFCTSADGLKIHARAIGPRETAALPVLCLPGLTRTTEDFAVLAAALATDAKQPRRVIAIDYRGRGLSDYDPDPAHYSVPVEAGDVMALAASLGITRAILVGTSRGGIISMALAASQPALIAGIVMNDIGPVVELQGLLKIKGYVGERPVPASYDDAAGAIRALFADVFPNLTDADWLAWAKRAFRDQNGRLVQTYDPKLAAALAGITLETPMAPAWELFDAMKTIPLLLIHGELSDLLSFESVKAMKARKPDLQLVSVADQGHAPLLDDKPTMDRIAAFCAVCDRTG